MNLPRTRPLAIRRGRSGEVPEGLRKRAGELLRAERPGAVHAMVDVGDRGPADDGILGQRVGRLGGDDGDRRALKPDLVEHLAELGVLVRLALKHRDLDAVIPGGLDVLQQAPLRGVDTSRPQQHTKTNLHTRCTPGSMGPTKTISGPSDTTAEMPSPKAPPPGRRPDRDAARSSPGLPTGPRSRLLDQTDAARSSPARAYPQRRARHRVNPSIAAGALTAASDDR